MENFLHNLQGEWHVVYSTLAMWKKPQNRLPRIVYDELDPASSTWRDTVLYFQHDTPKRIVGRDHLVTSQRFLWRGAGLLKLITCECVVLDGDASLSDYCLVEFGPTLFTRAGFDVYARRRDAINDTRLAHELMPRWTSLLGSTWLEQVEQAGSFARTHDSTGCIIREQCN